MREAARHHAGRLLRFVLHPATVALVCVLGTLVIGRAEHEWLSVPFAVASGAVIAAMLFLASGRAAFSLYLTWMVIAVLTAVSFLKFKLKGFSLHYYDVVFVARDPEIYRFLFGSYLALILPVLGLLALCAIAAVILFRADRRSAWPAATRVALLAVLSLVVPFTFPAEASRDRYFYYMQGRHMSAFFVSLADLGNMLTPHALEGRLAAMAPEAPFAPIVDCGEAARRPDIFFVLAESQTDPAYFPQVAGGAGFLSRFAPLAGPAHPLSVETFGGGTWITNLSVMTGLSAMEFGWRSPYLTVTLQNRIAGALPEALRRCGYRTAVITPMDFTFVNEGPFLRSIGFETHLDKDAIGAPDYHMRDDFYYRAAEAFIARHRKEDGRPLFLEIQTMFPHSPYEAALEPALHVAGEPFAGNGEAAEYLHRMAVARGDFETFLEARRDEAAGHPSIVFEFGDHQSAATKPFMDELAGPDPFSHPGSLAYRTFYTLTVFNHRLVRPLPDFPSLDVGYVGASVMEAAGLPMSPMMADLIRLRDHCGGTLFTCADRAAVDRHLRRRVDSGALDLFPQPSG